MTVRRGDPRYEEASGARRDELQWAELSAQTQRIRALTERVEAIESALPDRAKLFARGIERLDKRVEALDGFMESLQEAVIQLQRQQIEANDVALRASPGEPPKLSNEDITRLMVSGHLMWKGAQPVDIQDIITGEPPKTPLTPEDFERLRIYTAILLEAIGNASLQTAHANAKQIAQILGMESEE